MAWPPSTHQDVEDAVDQLAINVKAYGATGDSTTDDSTAIQAAIDACDPNRGGTVYFPQGRYRIATGLTVTYPGTVLAGEGQSGFSTGAQGSSRIVSDNGITAVTFNPGATPTHGTLGYGIRDLHVKAATAATTGSGIVVQNVEAFRLTNVAVSDYIGGVGLLIDGKTGNAQYATLVNFSGGDCLTVLKTQGTGPNGLRVFGAHLDSGNTTPRASSVGIHLSTGDTSRIFGAVVQGYATGIYVEASAVGHELFGPRVEYSNTCLRFGASVSKAVLFGGSFNNNLLGGGGTNVGIKVDSGAADVILMPTALTSLGTAIDDAGTGTVYPYEPAWGDVTGKPTFGTAATVNTGTTSGDIPLLSTGGVLPIARLATGTPDGTKFVRDDGTLVAPSSSGSITNSQHYITADVTMTTAGTQYDGPTLTLAAGTWLLVGSVQVLAATSAARNFAARLYDGSAVISSGTYQVVGTAAAGQGTIPIGALVSPASSTTYKIQATSTVNGDTLRGTSTKGSYLLAVKLA